MNMRCCYRLIVLIGLLITSCLSFAQSNAALGTWLTGEKDSKIVMYLCGDKLSGKIVWITNLMSDLKNPAPKLQRQLMVGAEIMKNVAYDGNSVGRYGSIYDAGSGKNYSCKLILMNKNQLGVRGYIGLPMLGRTTTWTRVQ